MLVRDIMTTGVKTVSPDTSVKDVAMVMCLQKISGMPVVDVGGGVLGIISEKDVLHHMFPDIREAMDGGGRPDFEELERNYNNTLQLTAGELMSKPASTVEADMPCLKAASMMWLRNIRRIPVTENKKLVGIISIGDVHNAIFKQHLLNQVS